MAHRLLRPLVGLALVGAALVGCADASPASAPAGEARAGATLDSQAFAELAAEPDVVLLDVRTPEEFSAGHLPDAVNLDVSAPGFAQAVGELDAEATYAVYCRSGSRSAQAVAVMLDAGMRDVAHLDGGISTWTGEVVTD